MHKLLLFLCFYHISSVINCTNVIVSTTTGKLKGKLVYDNLFNLYYKSFEGIPYAEPPIKNLRFQPPEPKKPWEGVLDATNPGYVCPQSTTLYKSDEMSEDCLVLNIFAPVCNTTSNYQQQPVLIYVHAGNFRSSSGNAEDFYGPELLVQKNNIVITLNYRLGALGFLSLNNKEASGNAAVKDVLMAIKWVHKNIEIFGGNPNQITIMGHGSGAAMVHVLLLTEKSTGLFQKAIILGGSITSPKYLHSHPREIAIEFCKELGINTSDTDENIIKKLKKIDAASIIEAEENIAQRNPAKGYLLYSPFTICIEINIPTAILTREPLLLIKEGIKQNVPMIVGFNNQEGLDIFPSIGDDLDGIISNLNSEPELLIPSDIEYPSDSVMRKNLANSIKEFYFKGKNISLLTVQNYLNLITDSSYSYSIDSWIKLHKEREDSASVYYNIFEFDSNLNLFKIMNSITYPGAAHVDDIGYTFVTKYTRSQFKNLDGRSKIVIKDQMNFLYNFLRYGNPTPYSSCFVWGEAGKNRNHIEWHEEPLYVEGPPFKERINFWYDVYARYYQYKKRIMKNGQ